MAVPIPYARHIIIYDMLTKQDNFDSNGIAILKPSKCEVTETLNGAWNAVLTHPIDEDGIWKSIRVFNHVKISGQLFTIVSVEHNYTGASGYVTAYCEHITYKMSDWWIYPDKTISGKNGTEVLNSIFENSWCPEYDNGILYNFAYSSDLTLDNELEDTLTDGKTKYQAIFDFISSRGGELYRDNFYFSVNDKMENSQENAFDIRIGLNLKGIRRKVDLSTFCTHFTGYDNYGGSFAVSYSDTSIGGLPIPNSIPRSKKFSYSGMSFLARDTINYFGANLAPDISYQIDLKDVRNNPDYQEFQNFSYKVGDIGTVYDERLGGKITLKITQTVTDGITGEVTKVAYNNVKGFISENSVVPVPDFPDTGWEPGPSPNTDKWTAVNSTSGEVSITIPVNAILILAVNSSLADNGGPPQIEADGFEKIGEILVDANGGFVTHVYLKKASAGTHSARVTTGWSYVHLAAVYEAHNVTLADTSLRSEQYWTEPERPADTRRLYITTSAYRNTNSIYGTYGRAVYPTGVSPDLKRSGGNIRTTDSLYAQKQRFELYYDAEYNRASPVKFISYFGTQSSYFNTDGFITLDIID